MCWKNSWVKVFFLLLFFGPFFLMSQEVKPRDIKNIVQKQKEVKSDLDNLMEKMKRVADRLSKTNPYYAKRLLEAFKKVKNELIPEDLAHILSLLEDENPQVGTAIKEGENVLVKMKKILDFLEEKEELRRLMKKWKDVKEMIKSIKELSEAQKKLYRETKSVTRQQNIATKFWEQLQGIISKQQKLLDNTQNETFRAKKGWNEIFDQLKQIRNENEELNKETKNILPKPALSLQEILERLDSIIKQSVENKDKIFYLKKAIEVLPGMLKVLAETAPKYDNIKNYIAKAVDNPSLVDKDVLTRELDKLLTDLARENIKLDYLELLENKKLSKAKELLSSSLKILEGLKTLLEDELYLEMQKEFETFIKSVALCENFLASLVTSAFDDDKNLLVKKMKVIIADITNLKNDMNKLLSSLPDALSKYINSANDFLAKGTDKVAMASTNLSKGALAEAIQKKEEAIEDLNNAKRSLLELAKKLAENIPDNTISNLFDKQDELQSRLSTTRDQLRESAKDLPAKDKKMQDELKSIQDELSEAQSSMNKASESFMSKSPVESLSNQKNANQKLDQALNKLKKMIDEISKREIDENKKLAAKQEKINKELNDVLSNMNEKVSQMAKEANTPEGKQNLGRMNKSTQLAGQASKNMEESSRNLRDNARPDSSKQQEEAIKKLEEALKELKEAEKEGKERKISDEQKRQLAHLAQRQDELRKKAKELSKSTDDKDTREKLGKASGLMHAASGQMQRAQPQKAEKTQQQIIRLLKKALEKLEEDEIAYRDEVDRARHQKWNVTIDELITEQRKINDQTISADAEVSQVPDKTKVSRTLKVEIKKLAGVQKELADDKVQTLIDDITQEEAAVYIYVLSKVKEDMLESSRLLNDLETGPYTQDIQKDILQKLEQLKKGFQMDIRKVRKSGGGGRGGQVGGQGGRGSLIPPLAELKMLKMLESVIKIKTNDLMAKHKNETAKEIPADVKKKLQRLGMEQSEVEELTKKTKKRLLQQ